MASRTGILSDAHSEKHCLEFNTPHMGYYQNNYHELPGNPNFPGIKLPRYVQTAQKPQSLSIAAVNMGKLLHKNNHCSLPDYESLSSLIHFLFLHIFLHHFEC